jgi:hypothetical protein
LNGAALNGVQRVVCAIERCPSRAATADPMMKLDPSQSQFHRGKISA